MSNILNEQIGMHETDITWEKYKTLEEYEKDKIYFIYDLTNQSEAIQELNQALQSVKKILEEFKNNA